MADKDFVQIVIGYFLCGNVFMGTCADVKIFIGQPSYQAIAWAFAVGQLFLLLKLYTRLSLLAGQTALYQAYALHAAGQASPK